MSGLTTSRTALGAAYEAAGLRVTFDPYRVTPPAVLVKGVTPWVSPSHLVTRRRLVRWEVTAVAGLTDSQATLEDLEGLVAAIVVATPAEYGLASFDGPGTVDIGGAQYLAAVGRVDHVTEV